MEAAEKKVKVRYNPKHRRDTGEAFFYQKKSLSVPTDLGDVPLAVHKRGHHAFSEEFTLNELRIEVDMHRLSKEELESVVKVLLMRISCYLDNKFVCY